LIVYLFAVTFCTINLGILTKISYNFSRIYVDVVFNHMTANFPNATGVGGCAADANNKVYQCVPYAPIDFHSTCAIINWNDAREVSNCDI
jgi:hypothetical protein